ncbi:MAG TPA: 3-ketoacyl-ACP reductase [Clostridia bacterium]|nr:3-ketoacyl-ACP reductase [Clostridia bacterium]HPQ45742.1 3-ketoacyl-ACP reductase [Clostridia bacterium]HRX43042.1 3-ketoacyl-ACP reductase [Clostridia bacterium]
MSSKKVALVTGAARGIGNGIALQLAKDGYSIAIMDVLAREDVVDNIQNVEETGAEVLYLRGDITKAESRLDVVEKTLEKFGRIDVLVNNAGVAPRVRMDILKTTEESFDFVTGINLKGTFFLTQLVANKMIEKVGELDDYRPMIVNIASMSSYVSSTSRGEYCISKAGVSMVTKLFADRLAEFGINVYEIRPGIILTPMTEVVKGKYDKLIAEGLTPIKRWGYPEDIANAVSAFCSGKFAFSTGEVVNVDGGFHIQRL